MTGLVWGAETVSQPSPPALEPLRAGNLALRLARDAAEIDAAQALRYRVFYEEMAAVPSAEAQARRRDVDSFDPFCDHLLVIDADLGEGPEAVVGTYRLLRRAGAARHGSFYSAAEYDIAALEAWPGEVLELGRSCVDARYRTRPTIDLLWRGIAAYVFRNDIGLMFGCASLHGTDPQALAQPLAYLFHNHLAPPALRARALPARYVAMDALPAAAVDRRRALAMLPPLIKGYLRLGGYVGDGAVIDRDFNTIDVCIIVETARVTQKYYSHYERSVRGAGGPAVDELAAPR